MQRGKSYDIPKQKAESMVRRGVARAAQAQKKQVSTVPEDYLEPRGEEPSEPVVEDEPAPEPEQEHVKKRSPRTKRLDGAPDNK
jgi:hypothetical protein